VDPLWMTPTLSTEIMSLGSEAAKVNF
jgi:hypothetical protein